MMDSVSHVKSETKTQALGGFLWEELMGTISLQASTPPPPGQVRLLLWLDLDAANRGKQNRSKARLPAGGGWGVGETFFSEEKKRKEKKMCENCLVRCQASEKSLPG